MLRKSPRLVLSGAVLLTGMLFALASCSDEGDPTGNGGNGITPWFPADYMTNADWDEVIDCRFSSPHGPGMRVHINPTSQSALYLDRDGRSAGFAVGTTIVKTEYTNPACTGTPVRVTVMRKGAAGTAPATGDWEWQEFRYDDEVEREGILTDCLSCHSGAANSECGPSWDYTCVIP